MAGVNHLRTLFNCVRDRDPQFAIIFLAIGWRWLAFQLKPGDYSNPRGPNALRKMDRIQNFVGTSLASWAL